MAKKIPSFHKFVESESKKKPEPPADGKNTVQDKKPVESDTKDEKFKPGKIKTDNNERQDDTDKKEGTPSRRKASDPASRSEPTLPRRQDDGDSPDKKTGKPSSVIINPTGKDLEQRLNESTKRS